MFSSNPKLNRSIDRAQNRRLKVKSFVNTKIDTTKDRFELEDTQSNASHYAYMTGYLQSMLEEVATAESIAEVRRVFRYHGVEL